MFNLLVSLGSTDHSAFTWDLSTWSSSRKSYRSRLASLDCFADCEWSYEFWRIFYKLFV